MNKIITSVFRLLILLLVCTVPAEASDKNSNNDETAKRKARYIFLEALRKKSLGEYDAYYELLRHAYRTDTTNTAVAMQLGYCIAFSGGNSKDKIMEGLELMKKHFMSSPEDYYESSIYGNLCGKMGLYDEALLVWTKLAELYPDKQELIYRLADAYADNKETDKAIALYDTIEARDGKSLPVTLKKVNYRLSDNDTAAAILEAKELLKTAPTNVDYNLITGNIYLQFAQTDSAMHYFEKAHDIEPDNGYVYLYKADCYRLQGDSVNYDKQIYNALINDNLDVEQKMEILTDYVRDELRGNTQKSERTTGLFNVLIEQHPHESGIHDLYSQYLVVTKDYDGAAEQLGYALDLDPANTDKWKNLVLIHMMNENYNEVFKTADKALEYNPDNIDLYQYIAPSYQQIGEYDKALEIYELALEKADTADAELRSSLVCGMGDVYFMRGDTIGAFGKYEQALEINPGNLMAMNNYAYFLAEAGHDLDKAERMSALTIKYEPENPTYLDTYAWVFFKKGEYSLALTYMKSALAHSLNEEASPELLEHMGDILFMNGKPDEALPLWEKALELKPDSEILQRKVKHKTFFFK